MRAGRQWFFNLLLCVSSGGLMTTVPISAKASQNQTVCLLKPQNKSLYEILEALSLQGNSTPYLVGMAKTLNPKKDFQTNIDSYNVFVTWQKQPSETWLMLHCQFIGSLSHVDLQQKSQNPNYGLPSEHLNLQAPAEYLASKAPQSFQSHSHPHQPPMPEQQALQPQHPSLSPGSAYPYQPQVQMPPQTEPSLLPKPEPQKAFQPKPAPYVELRLQPFMGYEFINGAGSGIINEFDLITMGIEAELRTTLFQTLSLFAKARFTNLNLSHVKSPSEVVMDFDHEYAYSAGFHLFFTHNFKIGGSYKQASSFLYSRGVPTFILNAQRQEVNTIHLDLDWSFWNRPHSALGISGSYGMNILSAEEFQARDFQTLFYVQKSTKTYIYRVSFGYEVLKVQYNDPPIDEVNRNRYLLHFSAQYPF